VTGINLEPVESWARTELDRKNAAREQALRWSRELVRMCANSIRAIHRHDFASAETLISEAQALNAQLCDALTGEGDLFWAGYVQDAQKELAEACCTLALVHHAVLPRPAAMSIAPAAFMNGLAEAVGELRRYVLDLLRRGESDECESLLESMDAIYSLLVTLDYPDALTGGLRRSTDNARGILEKTRGDLTLALQQQALVQALRAGGRS
jgi:translin